MDKPRYDEKMAEMTFTQVINVPHEESWSEADIEKALGDYHSGSEHGWNLMFGGLKDILSLYALIQQIGPERLAALSDQELKNAGEDYFKNEHAQALFSTSHLNAKTVAEIPGAA
jgi:hypothetical protein